MYSIQLNTLPHALLCRHQLQHPAEPKYGIEMVEVACQVMGLPVEAAQGLAADKAVMKCLCKVARAAKAEIARDI